MSLITRRRLIRTTGGAFCAGAAGLGWMGYVEPRWLDIGRHTVKLDRPLPRPVKLLHLSDMHFSKYVTLGQIGKAIDRGLLLEPDLVCITGDFVSTAWGADQEEYAKVLDRLGSNVPVYAIPGNHDGGGWATRHRGYTNLDPLSELLAAARIPLLLNASARLDIDGAALRIVGVGDMWARDMHPGPAFAAARPEETVVLLSHNPDSKQRLRGTRWDLMLCGHTHGGQLRIPVTGDTPFAPVMDKRYVRDLHRWEDRYLHITRGIGNLLGMRLNCRPEISLLTLV